MSLGIHSEVDEQRSEVGLFLEITLVPTVYQRHLNAYPINSSTPSNEVQLSRSSIGIVT